MLSSAPSADAIRESRSRSMCGATPASMRRTCVCEMPTGTGELACAEASRHPKSTKFLTRAAQQVSSAARTAVGCGLPSGHGDSVWTTDHQRLICAWNTPKFQAASERREQARLSGDFGSSALVRNIACSALRKNGHSAAAWNMEMFQRG